MFISAPTAARPWVGGPDFTEIVGSEIRNSSQICERNYREWNFNSETEGGLGLTIPSYRVDVQREADIIEEILRVYGYNNIDFSHKLNTSISFDSDIQVKVENVIADQLTSLGFNETMANSLTKEEYVDSSPSIVLPQNSQVNILPTYSRQQRRKRHIFALKHHFNLRPNDVKNKTSNGNLRMVRRGTDL